VAEKPTEHEPIHPDIGSEGGLDVAECLAQLRALKSYSLGGGGGSAWRKRGITLSCMSSIECKTFL
jgi:hypothetical protein